MENVQAEMFDAFTKEQKIYKNISGGYTVKLYFSFKEDNLYYLFLDYAPGGNFREILER
jgi:hypothetical protein